MTRTETQPPDFFEVVGNGTSEPAVYLCDPCAAEWERDAPKGAKLERLNGQRDDYGQPYECAWCDLTGEPGPIDMTDAPF